MNRVNESAIVQLLRNLGRSDYYGQSVVVTLTSAPNLYHIAGDGIDSYVSGTALFPEEDIRLHTMETSISKIKSIEMMNVTHRVNVFIHEWKPEFINGYCGNHIDLNCLLQQWDVDRESDGNGSRDDSAAHVSQDPRGMWYLLNE